MREQKIKYTKEQLEKAINNSRSIKEVISNLGLNINPGNYRVIHWYAKFHKLNLPKVDFRKATKSEIERNKIPDKEYFKKETYHSGRDIKKRLLNDYNYEDKCSICGLQNQWNDKYLVLQVDHIDGDRFNNELSNLRLVCPNCHSQTKTFSRNSITKSIKYNYCKCGQRIFKTSKKCHKCAIKYKIDWPPIEELLEMLKNSNYLQLGKKLGISDNAVRKHIKSYTNYSSVTKVVAVADC